VFFAEPLLERVVVQHAVIRACTRILLDGVVGQVHLDVVRIEVEVARGQPHLEFLPDPGDERGCGGDDGPDADVEFTGVL